MSATTSVIHRNTCVSNMQAQQPHYNLKRFIHKEMLHVPQNIKNKDALKKIWFEGGRRDKIQQIISTKNRLKKQDLMELKSLILEEQKTIQDKIKKISEVVNETLRTDLYKAFTFKKSELEIEDMLKDVEISADELTKKENQVYNTIINKITREINHTYANN